MSAARHPRRRRRPLWGIAIVSIAGAAAPTALADWSESQQLCTGCGLIASGGSPLAVAPNGDALATWGGGAAIRQGRARFGAPADLGTAGEVAAIGPDGTAAIAGGIIAGDRSLQTVVRVHPPGGEWAPAEPVPVRRLGGIAVDPAGNVHLVGNEVEPGQDYRMTERVRSPGGEWSSAQVISAAPPGAQTADPRLVAGPRGDLLAAWVENSAGLSTRLMTAMRGPAGEWRPPEELAPSALPVTSVRALALDRAGNALALFQRASDPSDVVAAFRPAGGPWGEPALLESQWAGGRVEADFDAAGNALAAWWGAGGRRGMVKVARRDVVSGGWGDPQPLSDGSRRPRSLALAVAPDGTSRVAWHEFRGERGHIVLWAAGSARTGGFGRAAPLARASRAPEPVANRQFVALEAERSGTITALWTQPHGGATSPGSVLVARSTSGPRGVVGLTPAQLRINQRISQAAVRRINALTVMADGLPAPEVASSRPPDRVTLSAKQLLINQRISQAAVRRANALANRLEGILSTDAAPPRSGDRVAISARQLLIGQRIAQAAVRRANALAERIPAVPFPTPGVGSPQLSRLGGILETENRAVMTVRNVERRGTLDDGTAIAAGGRIPVVFAGPRRPAIGAGAPVVVEGVVHGGAVFALHWSIEGVRSKP